jgi:hypothetical protein
MPAFKLSMPTAVVVVRQPEISFVYVYKNLIPLNGGSLIPQQSQIAADADSSPSSGTKTSTCESGNKDWCRWARNIWEREVASRYLHSYLAASLSRFFPVPMFHRH